MLKEVTGTASFDSKLEKMNGVLGECSSKKNQLRKILDAIQNRLGQLGQEIEEYREIQQIEREKKSLELILHLGKMEMNNREVDKLRLQKKLLMEEREKIQSKRENILEMNSNQKEQVEDLKFQIE